MTVESRAYREQIERRLPVITAVVNGQLLWAYQQALDALTRALGVEPTPPGELLGYSVAHRRGDTWTIEPHSPLAPRASAAAVHIHLSDAEAAKRWTCNWEPRVDIDEMTVVEIRRKP